MSTWTKENIGDIIVYKDQSDFGVELRNKKIAIYGVNPIVPNTVGFIEYPISLSSKIGKVGIVKAQQKESEEYLEKAGDWCFMGKVQSHVKGELERIALASKTLTCEDLSSPYTFH
jgi:hypothetical protein